MSVASAELTAMMNQMDHEISLRAQANSSFRRAFVGDLISGRIRDEMHARQHCRLVGLATLPSVALSISVDESAGVFQVRDAALLTTTDTVRDVVDELVDDASHCLVVPEPGGEVIVFLCPELLDDKNESAAPGVWWANTMRCAIARTGTATVTIGVGRTGRSPAGLKQSYEDARRATNHRFFHGTNRVYHIDEICLGTPDPSAYPYSAERDLCLHIRAHNRQDAGEQMSRLVVGLTLCSGQDPETLKARAAEVLVAMSRAALEAGASQRAALLLCSTFKQEVAAAETIALLREKMFRALEKTIEAVEDGRSLGAHKVLDQAVAYVRANCTSDITLNSVAEAVHLSPYYLSHLFKKHLACTFLEFCTQSRMEEARRLLRETNLGITEVAFRIGYRDTSHFRDVFRRTDGLSPVQYRRNWLDPDA